MTSLKPDQQLLDRERTVPFVGLTPDDTDAVSLSPRVTRKLGIGDDPQSLKEALALLPHADSGDLRSANEFVNDDGTIDVDAMRDVDGLDVDAALDALDADPETLTDATRFEDVPGHQEIIDQRREALSALGYTVKYQWQVASGKYAIINPQEAYEPGIQTLANYNEGTDVFGWLSYRDYGGVTDLFILFTDETVDLPDDLNYQLYLGYHSGYDFEGGRRLFLNHFGYYPKGKGKGSRLYNIGNSHKRKHVGDPTDAAHERDNDRIPIQEWWDRSHKAFLIDDTLATDINDAEAITISFEDKPFDLYGFFRLLDIPATQAEAAVSRVEAQTNGGQPSMWDIGIGLIFTLASEFSGEKCGPVFRARSRTATSIIRKPGQVMTRALREYQESGHPDEETDDEPASEQAGLGISVADIESAEDLAALDGVDIDDLSTEDKTTLLEGTEQALINAF